MYPFKNTISPDFIVNDEFLVEVKPKKLMNTPLNKLKFKAGEKYSKENNLKFKVIDVGIVEQTQLDDLIKNKIIKLDGKHK